MLVRAESAKTPITMWALLIWAYKRQMVRYEVDRALALEPAADGSRGLPGVAFWGERGCINGAGTTAHPDAHRVHAHVLRLPPARRDLVIKTAEQGLPPEWDPSIPPLRVIPMRKAGGAIKRIWNRSGNDVGCWITFEGVAEDEARMIRGAARDIYTCWWWALFASYRDAWIEDRLERWKISGIGVEREPWLHAY